ncbi:transaldolase family protein [Maridesulfovibrio salexigens]|uniref:Putative translaldolase n=1 Tax=Maridesulfovibrio salexigens (strain ATCC 14822 / DSM 2638 / NCIMB 8403 / VKM B-1763) TaxID=526222 RepID=C6BUK0_MARSD|nr:transaldolase family protein [Maridesulfovibrio salexigens]ACS80009.1 putative translaldolase [Maridesulfovibrio salexigens DSM 2638]
MKIYLRTCSLYEVRKAGEYGLIDGIKLLPENGEDKCVATDNDTKSIICCTNGPIFVSAAGNNSEDILQQALQLLRLSPNIVISIKATHEGFKACKILADKEVSVMITDLDSTTKAIMAAKSGAAFVCFNMKKVKQKSVANFKVLAQTVKLIRYHELHASVLANISGESIDLDSVTATGVDGLEITFTGLMKFLENDS